MSPSPTARVPRTPVVGGGRRKAEGIRANLERDGLPDDRPAVTIPPGALKLAGIFGRATRRRACGSPAATGREPIPRHGAAGANLRAFAAGDPRPTCVATQASPPRELERAGCACYRTGCAAELQRSSTDGRTRRPCRFDAALAPTLLHASTRLPTHRRGSALPPSAKGRGRGARRRLALVRREPGRRSRTAPWRSGLRREPRSARYWSEPPSLRTISCDCAH